MKNVFIGLTLALAGLTAFLAWGTATEIRAARDAARSRLPEIQAATAQHLRALVEEGVSALNAWQPDAAVPAPLETAEEVRASESPTGGVVFEGVDASVWINGRRIEIVVTQGPQRFRRGLLPIGALRARLVADPNVGEPALPDEDIRGRFTRVLLIADDTGAIVWSMQPATVARKGMPSVASLFVSEGSGTTKAMDAVRAGERTGVLDYKDADSHRTTGAWQPLAGATGISVIAEVRDDVAIYEVRGTPLGAGEFQLGFAHAWHLALAAAILSLVLTVFLALQRRKLRYGVLLRTFSFVSPYRWGVAAVVGLGLVFIASTFVTRVFLPKKLLDDVLIKQGPDAVSVLWQIGIAIIAMALITAVTAYLKEYLHNYFATAIMADIRVAIGRKIVSLPLSYFDTMRAGDLVARVERDASSMRKVFNEAFKTGAVDPFDLIAAAVAAFIINWRLALVLVGMPIIVFPLFKIAKRIKRRAEQRQELLAEISHVIFQMLVGIKVVKAFGGAEREAQRLRDATTRFIKQARRVHRLSAMSTGLMDLLQMVGAAIVMVAGGFFVLDGEITVGDITAFTVILQRVYKASKRLTRTATQLVNALPGVVRVYEVLDAPNDLVDGPNEMARQRLAEGIRFEGVSFAYGDKNVLSDVDLDIPAGQIVALVGPTGAGKSTLCDLVARFYDASAGRVTYDGVDVREFTVDSLMENVAIVTQDAFLFNASIADNILYGRPGATADDIRAAAEDAFVHDEIEKMEGGYEMIAGERGSSVSGGQRQRITIARALIKDAPVLILDEATSALDTHAEKRVQAALEKLMAGRTVIVVAHRLSTIRHADRVVVMRDGRVVEQGPPDELLAREGGQFRAMYELQMGRGSAGDSTSEDDGDDDDGDDDDDSIV